MRNDDRIRLQHMLDAANEALGFIQGKQRSDLDVDLDVVWSTVTRDLPSLKIALEKIL